MVTTFPNTGSTVGLDPKASQISTGLSTQIIIKVNQVAVGALQQLSVNQARPLDRIKEIGTDGIIEIVPNGATTFEMTANRIVFDQLRLPEAFSRGFRFINAQRLPFDIEVFDLTGIDPNSGGTVGTDLTGIVVVTYKNCWFQSYATPYAADNYIVTETATIWCETAYISTPDVSTKPLTNQRGIVGQTDGWGVESSVNSGGRRGSMDAGGILGIIAT
jgi:hypothetical protein